MEKNSQIARKIEKKSPKDNVEFTIKFNKTKLLKGFGVVLVVVAILGLAFMVSSKSSAKTNPFEFVDITIDDYLDMMKIEGKSLVYVARPGCSWCQKQSPIIKKLGGEYKLTIYYLNTDSFWDSDENKATADGEKFMASSEKYAEGWGTPNTIIIGNGEIIDGEFGYSDEATLKDLFVRNGFINE